MSYEAREEEIIKKKAHTSATTPEGAHSQTHWNEYNAKKKPLAEGNNIFKSRSSLASPFAEVFFLT